MGSSPLTRGKLGVRGANGVCGGLIPAHAGKTSATHWRPLRSRAHPRSRGENVNGCGAKGLAQGSSPLTRGKLGLVGAGYLVTGLIPAHAGKTPRAHQPRPSPRAHPRSRGENPSKPSAKFLIPGSSPLTRGKPRLRRPRRGQNGLIPAHAGKTRPIGSSCRHTRAHPRSRGENTFAAPMMFLTWGSSPLTRGKRPPGSLFAAVVGLIPAHAGKTCQRRASRRSAWAHPRSRGENANRAPRYCTVTGSSPLTRGKLEREPGPPEGRGLIPAHAGKTYSWRFVAFGYRAHPRSRGENRGARCGAGSRGGSSPLTRGKPERRGDHAAQEGLIPAHAGKTAAEGGPA